MRSIALVLGIVLVSACSTRQSVEREEFVPASRTITEPRVERTAAAEPTVRRNTNPTPAPVLRWVAGLAEPASVLYDAPRDRYLVSNIDGGRRQRDNNGYIAILTPDGALATEKLVAGGMDHVTLDAPKGLAIANQEIYVADISVVRRFAPVSGAPHGDVEIRGAKSLNDVAAAPDGRVFVSDEETGVIYAIAPDGDVERMPGAAVEAHPVQLLVSNGRLTPPGELAGLPGNGVDGIVATPEQTLFVSDPRSSTIYRGRLGGQFEPVISGVTAPGDLGYDAKRGRLLVPRAEQDMLEAYEVR